MVTRGGTASMVAAMKSATIHTQDEIQVGETSEERTDDENLNPSKRTSVGPGGHRTPAARSNLFGLPRMKVNFVQLFGSHGKVNPRRWTGIDHAHG